VTLPDSEPWPEDYPRGSLEYQQAQRARVNRQVRTCRRQQEANNTPEAHVRRQQATQEAINARRAEVEWRRAHAAELRAEALKQEEEAAARAERVRAARAALEAKIQRGEI
jgi:hypothetical protein